MKYLKPKIGVNIYFQISTATLEAENYPIFVPRRYQNSWQDTIYCSHYESEPEIFELFWVCNFKSCFKYWNIKILQRSYLY